MGKYGEVSLEVTRRLQGENEINIYATWKEVASEIFKTESSINKGCPRSSYIGLCEAGRVKGISAGKYRKGRSVKNKNYALDAVRLLEKESSLYKVDEKELWKKIVQDKKYNQQMDVVLTLWKEGFIK